MKTHLILIAAVGLFAEATSTATPITFDLRDTGSGVPDNVPSGAMTVGGITATLSTGVGDLNQTGSGFGVNATASGDDTDALDAGSGTTESLSIIFNTDVFLTGIGLSLFTPEESTTPDELASLTIGGNSTLTLVATGPANDIYTFTSNNFVSAGESIELGHLLGNGFSFDNFTVEAASIPDGGSTLALLLAPLCGIFFSARRKLERRS